MQVFNGVIHALNQLKSEGGCAVLMPGTRSSGKAQVVAGALPTINCNVGIAQSCLKLKQLQGEDKSQCNEIKKCAHGLT